MLITAWYIFILVMTTYVSYELYKRHNDWSFTGILKFGGKVIVTPGLLILAGAMGLQGAELTGNIASKFSVVKEVRSGLGDAGNFIMQAGSDSSTPIQFDSGPAFPSSDSDTAALNEPSFLLPPSSDAAESQSFSSSSSAPPSSGPAIQFESLDDETSGGSPAPPSFAPVQQAPPPIAQPAVVAPPPVPTQPPPPTSVPVDYSWAMKAWQIWVVKNKLTAANYKGFEAAIPELVTCMGEKLTDNTLRNDVWGLYCAPDDPRLGEPVRFAVTPEFRFSDGRSPEEANRKYVTYKGTLKWKDRDFFRSALQNPNPASRQSQPAAQPAAPSAANQPQTLPFTRPFAPAASSPGESGADPRWSGSVVMRSDQDCMSAAEGGSVAARTKMGALYPTDPAASAATSSGRAMSLLYVETQGVGTSCWVPASSVITYVQ